MVKTIFFRGFHPLTLDNKGRMFIPSFYRKNLQVVLEVTWIITIDPMDLCLWLYPLKEWKHIEKKLQTLPSFEIEARRIMRLLIDYAIEVIMDTQNRILIRVL